MCNRISYFVLPVVLFALGAPSATRAGPNPTTEVEQRAPAGAGVDEPFVPLPRPVPPEIAPGVDPGDGSGGASSTADGPTFQLVGFTQQTLDGIQGVLNYTLACQVEFPDSRMCTADEIRHTVRVPRNPGSGYAWISEFPRLTDSANCRGWDSSSNSDAGTAINLDARYGVRDSHPCNQPLRIACCSMIPLACTNGSEIDPRRTRIDD
jgi:hypothetical protein